jgi:ribosome-binding protein aMBF1 (putative translation factor)
LRVRRLESDGDKLTSYVIVAPEANTGMRDDLKVLGRRLRDARVDAGLSQVDIARRLNISKQLVSHWELARSEIAIGDLVKVAQITGTSTDFLLTGHANTSGGAKQRLPEVACAVTHQSGTGS